MDVETWLKTLPLARGSSAKIRNLMSALFSPAHDPKAKCFAADAIGYLIGHAQLTNTRHHAHFDRVAKVSDPLAQSFLTC